MECIRGQDGSVRDIVIGEGQPPCHSVREDTDDVYDGIAVQQCQYTR